MQRLLLRATGLALLLSLVLFGSCLDSQYIGFDSRLKLTVVGRLPMSDAPVTGFEIAGGNPVVLLKTRLLQYENGVAREMALDEPMNGLTVDAGGAIRLVGPRGLATVTANGVQPDDSLKGQGRLYNSGAEVFLDVFPEGTMQRFLLRRPGADAIGVAGAEGELRTASWNSIGLAAVVGRSLFAWSSGSEDFERLLIDNGLKGARDVTLAGPHRAVVTVSNGVVLVSEEDQIIVAGMNARCRFSDGFLYVLDEGTGLIWRVSGIEKLGVFQDDTRHARDLISTLPKGAGESSPRFLEAARIIGCTEARKVLAEKASQ